MATTPFQLPTAVISNGSGVNGWLDPSNILLVDNQFAVASGITNILSVGIFNLSIPQDSTITNFTIKVRGYRGSFNTTLQIYAVDNSTGVDIAYPLAPFQGFSGTNTTYTLPSSLFGTSWTSDQANNIQLKLIADGELHLDSIQIEADYVANVTPIPVPPSSGLVVVDEFVEAIRFNLAQSMTDTDIYFFLQSFNLPDGTPIQYADFHGEACLVIDQGIQGLEEQVVITAVDQDYQGTGLCRLTAPLINRGLKFIYPYDTDPALRRNHSGTAEVVISNSARFYSRFLRINQINALVSAPIIVQDEGSSLVDPAHTLDFQGAGVVVVNDGLDSFKKIITIPGNGVNPPNVVSTSSATSGASQVPTLTWSHTSSGINRLLVVQVEAEAATTITGITYNGVALTQSAAVITNGTLRNEQWYLIAPPVGTYSIVVSVAPDSYLTCGAESYVSTNQVSPIGVTQTAVGSSLTSSLVLVTGTDNSLIVDSLATGSLPMAYTAGAGQSENWHITANPNVRQGASSVENAGSFPDNVTMSWAITQNVPWAQTALEIKGVSSPGSTDELVRVSGTDTTSGFLNPKLNLHSSDGSVTVLTTITNPGANEILDVDLTTLGGGGGGTTNLQVDATPDSGTYGTLVGAVDGLNALYTVSLAAFQPGKLIVTLNGLTQNQGGANDFTETNPLIGTFTFNVPPPIGSTILAEYQTVASIGQTGIQFEDETGAPLGAAGTVDEVEVSGGSHGTRVGNKVNYDVGLVSNTDTTGDFLQAKINIHSSDGSVTVTPTVTNPGANEILDIDLTGAGGGTFTGFQNIEDNTATPNFGSNQTSYDPADGSIWKWDGGGTLEKKYIVNSSGAYQPIYFPSYSGIVPPAGQTFSSLAPIIYNGNAYLFATNIIGATAHVKFRVIRLSDGVDLGETNEMTTYNAAAVQAASICCTNAGRIVLFDAFNNFLHAHEADITATLVIGAPTVYVINASQAFTGAPLNWASYKATNANKNIFIQNQYYDYGTATLLAQAFSVDSRVVFMGTTLAGKTIIGRQVTNTAGNPGTQPGQYLVISLWDTIGADDGVTYNL